MQDTGKFLIILGLVVVIIGVVLQFGWAPGLFGWMGHLPGDVRVEKENYKIFFPITTMILLSIVFTVILRIFMMIKGQ